jgi:hypothetical protein
MRASRLNRIVWLGVVGFALAFYAAGAWLAAARLRHAESMAKAAGKIVEIKSYVSTSGGTGSTSARVRYRTADGRDVEFTDGLIDHTLREGGEVEVLYDPRSPQDAEIRQGLWIEPGILFLVGTMPLAARLVWSYKEYKERRRRRRKGIPDVEERIRWPATSRRPRLPE